jgi:pimeloyl-ACP methyl ester carboxylesterase
VATIVLAHGAWSSAWAWKKMRPLMAAAGHQFFTPSYTGLGERAHLVNPSIDLMTHVNDVLGVIETEELSDFVLLGHSYGGMVATGVATKIPDRIAQLIYLDAFVPRNGQSLADLVPQQQAAGMKEKAAQNGGWLVPGNPAPEDTSPEDLAWVSRHRRPHPLKCMEQRLEFAAEPSMPRAYIQCMRYPHGPFGQFASRAKSEKGWKSYEIDSSHSPNVTAPDALMKVLSQAIAERGN